jgi:hypothetical protein
MSRLTSHPRIIKLKLFIANLNIGVIDFAENGNLNDYLKQQSEPVGMFRPVSVFLHPFSQLGINE